MDWDDLGKRWRFTTLTNGQSSMGAEQQVITHVDGELRWNSATGPRIGPGTLLHANTVIYATKAGADGQNVYFSYIVLTP
jgi:hypothetical protein